MVKNSSTIIGIATPVGEGGIGILRLSGDNAHGAALKMLELKSVKDIGDITFSKMYYGRLNAGGVQDEVLCVFFKAPASFTGEDIAEIHCHGSNAVLNACLEFAVENNLARLSGNGEFTKRAFLNNKLDLTKAEGIIDIIKAQSVSEVNAAYGMISGKLYKRIEKIQNDIIQAVASMNAIIDYPEEDLEDEAKEETYLKLNNIIAETGSLLDSYKSGRLIKEGVKAAIIGEPNVGKSKLLNALIGKERAIVTDIEGTTRDTIEETFIYKGMKFILTDTAGLRETLDPIEKSGIERSYRALREADIVLQVFEAGKDKKQNPKIAELIKDKPVITVKNKTDLIDGGHEIDGDEIYLSALSGKNVDKLKEMLYNRCYGSVSQSGVFLSNARQYEAALSAQAALNDSVNAINAGLNADIIISDLNHAYRILGEITGLKAGDEIINSIFERFCVGK